MIVDYIKIFPTIIFSLFLNLISFICHSMYHLYKQIASTNRNERIIDHGESLQELKNILFSSERLEQENEEGREADVNCEHRIGKVTFWSSDYGMIDDKYCVSEASILRQKNMFVGQTVKFTIYQPDPNKAAEVKKVVIYEEEMNWDSIDRSTAHIESQIISSCVAREEIIASTVVQRDGRLLTFLDNMTGDLNKMNCEFSPIVGDAVLLESLVEEKTEFDSNDTKRMIEIKVLKAARKKNYEGRVTHWQKDEATNEMVGIIGYEVYFTAGNCDYGYSPKKDDRVLARVIESRQGSLTWRATNVIPLSTPEHNTLNSKINEERLFDGKNGVLLSFKCEKNVLKIEECTTFEISVENAGKETQTIENITLNNEKVNDVMKIKTELIYPIVIESMKTFIFEIEATAKRNGNYSEIVVVKFKGDWTIGIILEICVEIEEELAVYLNNAKSTGAGFKNVNKYYERRLNAMKKLVPSTHGFIIAGNRPTRVSSFLPKKLGLYTVPMNINNLIIGDCETLKNKVEIKSDLLAMTPTMAEELHPRNYLLKFHNLLYLEDIEMQVAIKKYDEERTCFTKQGEFLVMGIENLAESRPSLIIGDSLLAMDPSSENANYMEGHIHQVTKDSIKLKFNEAFHNSYDNRFYSVTFRHNRTSIRRCHMAVDEVFKHLKPAWLFPDSISDLKTPHINIIGEHPMKNDEDHLVEHKCEVQTKDGENNDKLKACDYYDALLDSDDDSNNEDDIETMKKLAWKKARLTYKTLDRDSEKNEPVIFTDDERLRVGGRYGHIKPVESLQRKTKVNCQNVVLKWVNKSLNHYQKEAVRNILRAEARPLPYIIFGPPGTGKTVTVVETIIQILYLIPDSRLLIATPSNSSADLICERLLDYNLLKPGDLIRLMGYNHMSERRTSSRLWPYCTCIDTKNLDKNYKDENYDDDGIKFSPRARIGMHRVTVSTCSTVGNLYSMGFPKNHYTHVIVDEAGQATEPEIMIPFAFLGYDGHAVLAGDPLQLGPVVSSSIAASMGLSESFLSRLHIRFPYHRDPESFPDTDGYDPRLVTRLLYNYRALPKILDLYSTLFYEKKLIPRVCETCSEEAKLLKKLEMNKALQISANQQPQCVIFDGVKGRNQQSLDSPSWYNDHEITRVITYLVSLYNVGTKIEDIGVVTPYQKQVKMIREMLNEMQLPLPKVGTVEEFQGQEKQVIIISTVRSDEGMLEVDRTHALGFVSSKQRVNVAISRAQAVLIIIGNPHLLASDSTWRNLIKICYMNGYYVGCDLPQSIIS